MTTRDGGTPRLGLGYLPLLLPLTLPLTLTLTLTLTRHAAAEQARCDEAKRATAHQAHELNARSLALALPPSRTPAPTLTPTPTLPLPADP